MRSLVIAVLAVLALGAGVASANGRAPQTNGIFFKPADPRSLYVRTTFGLLISHDDGCTFNWICEQDVGYGGSQDPKYAIAADGTIFAATQTAGLRVSRDGGCSFTTAPLPVSNPALVPVWIEALDVGPSGAVWIGTTDMTPNDVFRSTDNGATFVSRGLLSPTIWWKSVKVAPSDAKRVYVTGYQVAGAAAGGDGSMQPMAHLLRSDDDGDTWTELPLFGEQRDPPTLKFGSTPIVYVLAVDPNNPDVVLLSSLGAKPPIGDRLYRSTDAGKTFAEVLATTDPIRDVVFRDSQTVVVATIAGGSFQSTDNAKTFQLLAGAPELACLGQRSDHELIGCGANWVPDYKAVARTTDAQTWDKVWRFVNLAGPLDCPAGTAEKDTCTPLWPSLQQQFATTGPSCGVGPDGPPDGATDTAAPVAKKTGCCDASTGAPVGLVLLVGAWLLRRRR